MEAFLMFFNPARWRDVEILPFFIANKTFILLYWYNFKMELKAACQTFSKTGFCTFYFRGRVYWLLRHLSAYFFSGIEVARWFSSFTISFIYLAILIDTNSCRETKCTFLSHTFFQSKKSVRYLLLVENILLEY